MTVEKEPDSALLALYSDSQAISSTCSISVTLHIDHAVPCANIAALAPQTLAITNWYLPVLTAGTPVIILAGGSLR